MGGPLASSSKRTWWGKQHGRDPGPRTQAVVDISSPLSPPSHPRPQQSSEPTPPGSSNLASCQILSTPAARDPYPLCPIGRKTNTTGRLSPWVILVTLKCTVADCLTLKIDQSRPPHRLHEQPPQGLPRPWVGDTTLVAIFLPSRQRKLFSAAEVQAQLALKTFG